MTLSVLIPAKDDWTSLNRLLIELGHQLGPRAETIHVLIVDDASRIPCHVAFNGGCYERFQSIQSLRLRRNLSHQRAIAIGLMHLYAKRDFEAVLILDADGEDTPDGAALLVDRYLKLEEKMVIFAERSRRTEAPLFRAFYWLYRQSHLVLTGQKVRVGNFSIVPRDTIGALSVMPELWNHFAAAVFRSGEPFIGVPVARGRRYAGESKMNFVSLVVHGLSAISVFAEVMGTRLLMVTFVVSVAAFAGIFLAVAVRFLTDAAIPGWTTYTVGILFVLFVQLLSLSVSFTLSILAFRSSLSFLPIRDFSHFILEIHEISSHG